MHFTFPIYQFVFYTFSTVTLLSALMVVLSRNPVVSILFLVLCFFSSSVLWMSLQAEFLSLLLIFVYVGAVMTLFLFVVMMLNVDLSTVKASLVRYFPLGFFVAILLIGVMLSVLGPERLSTVSASPAHHSENYNNLKEVGMELYIHFRYPFEISSLILLVAIISAIALAYRGRRPGNKAMRVPEQTKVSKKDRLRVLDIDP